jgi:CheY-like chemotaxis protein
MTNPIFGGMRVFTSRSRFVVGAALTLLAFPAGPAWAQDKKGPEAGKEAYQKILQRAEDEYRIFFKQPETVPEFWTAINFEIDVGKFDIAALLLKQLVEKQPAAETDKELVRIEEAQGLSTFLRLRRVRQWSDNPTVEKEAQQNVESLISRVSQALDRYLADPERIGKFIKSLDAPTVEERAYAFGQLNRAGDRAAPFLLEALRKSVGTPLHRRLRDTLVRLSPEGVTPLYAALYARDAADAKDFDLRVALLDVIKARGEKEAVAELWQLAALPQYPASVRERARETLAHLLQVSSAKVPASRAALVELARAYARHELHHEAPRLSQDEGKAFQASHKGQQPVAVWTWGAKGLTRAVMPAPEADLQNGLHFAREALQVEPAYRPAQSVFVALSLEQAFGKKLDETLVKTPAALQRLLATVDADLLEEVLDSALGEGNLPVMLGAIQALGEHGDARLARPSAGTQPRGLARALYYPDRRVQLAAARAMLRSPDMPAPAAAARVVEVLRRFVAMDPVRVLLFVHVPDNRKADVRKAVQGAGFEPIFVTSTREAFDQLHVAANIDAVFIDYTAPEAELPYVLTQLRSDPDIGHLPVLLIAPSENRRPDDKARDVLLRQQFQNNQARLAEGHRNTWTIPEAAVLAAEPLKQDLQRYFRYAALPDALARTAGTPSLRLDRLSDGIKAEESTAELKLWTSEALAVLLRMARGEAAGYDLRPALPAVLHALLADDTAVQAIELLGRIPGPEGQQRLAGVVLDTKRAKLRPLAAAELNRNIQRYGQTLTRTLPPDQLRQLRRIVDNAAEDALLRSQVALLMSRIGETPRQTGMRLYQFTPEVAAPAR